MYVPPRSGSLTCAVRNKGVGGPLSMRSLLKVLGFAVVFFAFPLLGMAQAPVPDMILTGGKIVTLDARDTLAEALAINHGRISFVGSAAQIRALAGPQGGGRSRWPDCYPRTDRFPHPRD